MKLIARASVLDAFVPFTDPIEGTVYCMYADIYGWVTTAIGVKIDPIELARPLAWIRKDSGERATQVEIETDWHTVKGTRALRKLGWRVAEKLTKLRLTDVGVEQAVMRKLADFDTYLSVRFPEYADWCADAQLATLSMAWACGAAFAFPKLEASLRAKDFACYSTIINGEGVEEEILTGGAAYHCHINEDGLDRIRGNDDDNVGLAPRNVANKIMYRNASAVHGSGLDPDTLYYPGVMY